MIPPSASSDRCSLPSWIRYERTLLSAAATWVSAEGCGQNIRVSAIGPNVRLPESGAAALNCQVEEPRLQSTWNAARPSSPNVTVYFDGSAIVVFGCSSGAIESMPISCQVVPVRGSAACAEPQPDAESASAVPATARTTIMRMFANLPSGECRARCAVGNTGGVSRTDAELAADLAEEAGRLLLAVREEIGHDFPPALGDAGDVRANALLLRRLRAERPGDAVLSEEAHDDLKRLRADRVWIIDPLDGTREYSLPHREDWAVHVALWQRTAGSAPSDTGDADGAITDAAVALPALGEVHRSDAVTPPAPRPDGPIRITASSNRPPAVLWLLRDRMDIEFIRIGSAGAKAMAVLRGDADVYIHAGGQWEWDNAAPAGVLQAAGFHATRLDGSPLRYNRPDPYLPDLLMGRPEVAERILDAIWQAS